MFFFYLIFFDICQSLGLLKSKLCSCIFYPTLFMKWFKKNANFVHRLYFFLTFYGAFQFVVVSQNIGCRLPFLSFFVWSHCFAFYSNNNTFCLASHLSFFFLCRLNLAILPLCVSLPAFFSISFKNQHSILAKEYFS